MSVPRIAVWQPLWRTMRPIWGAHGTGIVWLGLGFGVTVSFGLILQLLALRGLSGGGYSTFVAAIGIGNIASAIAVTLQPVVAARSMSGSRAFLPCGPRVTVVAAVTITASVAVLLGLTLGPATGLLAALQLPLHAVAGIGLGRLQARSQFGRMAVALSGWGAMRLVVVGAAVSLGEASPEAFVLALPLALLAELAILWAAGAYRGVGWQAAPDSKQLMRRYAVWGLFAWLMNADALYGGTLLDTAQRDLYAVALTLGRQPVYAVAPLATVLLPAALASTPGSQRARLRSITLVSLLLFVGASLVIGLRPEALVGLLSGGTQPADAMLMRGYVVIGSLTAFASLALTLTFAVGALPDLRRWGSLALLSAAVALLFVATPQALLALQGAVVGSVTAGLAVLAWRATSAHRDHASDGGTPVAAA